VAADIEEGAIVAEAVLEEGKLLLMQSRVPNLQTRPEATLLPGIDGDPGRNLTPVVAACCPTVGANCRGNLETVAMGMAYRRGSTVVTMGPAWDCANRDTSVTQVQGPPRWR
jgi:hypothetical protein